MSDSLPCRSGRGHLFPDRSFRAMVGHRIANQRFSLGVSSSAALGFLASFGGKGSTGSFASAAPSMPPDLVFHLKTLAPLTLRLRPGSATGLPASSSGNSPIICSSKNAVPFHSLVLTLVQNDLQTGLGCGGKGQVCHYKHH